MKNVNFLYKYTTFEAALAIFGSLHLKWSSPILFNDPFDTKGGIYGFTSEEFADCYDKKLKNEMYSDEKIGISRSHEYYDWINNQRHLSHEKRRVEYESKQIWVKEKNNFENNLHNKMDDLWEVIRRSERVLCLTKNKNCPLMWSHYADSHKGVMLKFRRIEGLNSIVSEAEQLEYRKKFPVYSFTPDEVVDDDLYDKKINYETDFYQHLITKSTVWKYEKEWRCILDKLTDNNDFFEFREFNPLEIDSVYLGCQMREENEKLIKATLQNQLKHVKVFKAVQGERSYGLEYVKI